MMFYVTPVVNTTVAYNIMRIAEMDVEEVLNERGVKRAFFWNKNRSISGGKGPARCLMAIEIPSAGQHGQPLPS